MEVRSFEAIISVLNKANVRYLIVGGLAVNAHGYQRMTDDIDLVIGLESENITSGLKAIASIGYKPSIPVTPEEFADLENRNTWRKEKGMLVLKLWSDRHHRTPVDVFVFEPFDFEQEYDLAEWLSVTAELDAPILRIETLMKMKEAAGRPQDLADIDALRDIQRLKEQI